MVSGEGRTKKHDPSGVIPNGVIGSDARLELHHDRELLAPRGDRVTEPVVVAAVAPVGVGVGVGMVGVGGGA